MDGENLVRSETYPIHIQWHLNLMSTVNNRVPGSPLSISETNFVPPMHKEILLEQTIPVGKHAKHKGAANSLQ